jgi:hypothetical protein
MKTSNNQNRRFRNLIIVFSLAHLFLFIACDRVWLDNGTSYLCPECKYKGVYYMAGECELCHCETGTVSYKYCYDCAKALDCCQMCGIKR